MLTVIPSLSLVAISGIGTLSSSQAHIPQGYLIGFGICGLFSGFLLAVNTFLKYNELQQQHDFFSDAFMIFHNDIQMNLSLQNTSEPTFRSFIEFTKYMKYRLDILIDKAPPIPPAIMKKHNNNPQTRDDTSLDIESSVVYEIEK